MASYYPPKKNTALVFYVSLTSQADTKSFQANPTLAAGDVKVAVDDAAPANLTTLPVVDADFTKRVKVSLSAAEMNGDRITVIFADAAGAEWCDLTIDIATVTTNQIDDLARADALTVIDDFLDTEIADILDRLPAALVSGRMDASVGAMAANTLTASALATDAVTELIAAVFANDLESGKTFAQAILDLWAKAVGDAAANNADTPTSITYDSPDGSVQVTHTHTTTTRVKV